MNQVRNIVTTTI